jgi:hypothetical protein
VALDQLVSLARALWTTVDALLADDDPDHDNVIIRSTSDVIHSVTWMLTRNDDPSGRIVAKMRIPDGNDGPSRRSIPGERPPKIR